MTETYSNAASLAAFPQRRPLTRAVALAFALGGAGAAQSATFNVSSNADAGPGTLRQAVEDANNNFGADDITFNVGLGPINVGDQINITDDLTITGPAAGQVLDGGGDERILAVTAADALLTLENLTLQNGRTTVSGVEDIETCTDADGFGEGGAICSLGNLTLINTVVTMNMTTGNYADGGGIFVDNGTTLMLTDSTVSNNSTTGYDAEGGGIFADNESTVTLINSTVSNNSTTGNDADGGGMFADGDSTVTLTNTTVSNNSTTDDNAEGGGIHLDHLATLTLTDSTVSNNSTAGESADGGGIYIDNGGMLVMTRSTVSNNSTAGESADGGGIFVDYDYYVYGGVDIRSTATLTDSTVSNNTAADEGGGIYMSYETDLTLTNSIVSGNTAQGGTDGDGDGGGIYMDDDGTMVLTNSIVSGNTAQGDGGDGGGIFVNDYSVVTLIRSTVSDNTAGDDGGGIWVDGSYAYMLGNSTLTLINSTVSGNEATADDSYGGGIYTHEDAVVFLNNSTIANNITGGDGDGVFFEDSTVTLTGTIIAGNDDENCHDSNSNITGTFNLIQDMSPSCDLPNDFGNNIVGAGFDPLLADLADNGCDVMAGAPDSAACVQTHALLAGSPAIDTGSNPDGFETDQRGDGFNREVPTGSPDIGAFEFGAGSLPPPIPVLSGWGLLTMIGGLLGLLGWRSRPRRRVVK